MKIITLRTLLVIIITVLSNQNNLFAQNQWVTTNALGNDLNTANRFNVLGTDGIFTPVGKRDIRFLTSGVERMRLMGDLDLIWAI